MRAGVAMRVGAKSTKREASAPISFVSLVPLWLLWILSTIEGLFEKECQIMRLLHVDSLTQSPTWYLDACGQPDTKASRRTRLFLCGHDLGFQLDGSATQDAFDFEAREKQLFGGREMGEDVRRLLKDYVGLLDEVRATVTAGMPVLKQALAWAGKAFGK